MQTEQEEYYFHLIAFWRSWLMAALLVVLGAGGLWIYPPAGLGCLVMAVSCVVGIYYCRRWHSLCFIGDNRLLRRHGFRGTRSDLVTLFGRISPSQVPFFGEWFDIGSVHLGIPGPDIHLRHIARFRSFYNHILYGQARQQANVPDNTRSAPAVHVVVINVPPVGPGEPAFAQLPEQWTVFDPSTPDEAINQPQRRY